MDRAHCAPLCAACDHERIWNQFVDLSSFRRSQSAQSPAAKKTFGLFGSSSSNVSVTRMPSVMNMVLSPSFPLEEGGEFAAASSPRTNPNVSLAVASSPNKSPPFGSTPMHAATTRTSETVLLFDKRTVALLYPFFSTKGTTSLISQFASIVNQSTSNRAFTTDVKYAPPLPRSFSFSSTFSRSSSLLQSSTLSFLSSSFSSTRALLLLQSSSSEMSSKSKAWLMRLNQSGPAEDVLAHTVAPNAPRRRG